MRGIFISYRRQDSQSAAGRLADHLKEQMPDASIFRDVETIEPGVDFVDAINHAMTSCAVLLAVIGPRWMTVTGANGRRRLDDPHDYNRLEIATALKRNDVRVIPVLVEGAVMPATDDLPEDLKPLSRRNAVELTDKRWEYDVGQLIETLKKILHSDTSAPLEPHAIATPAPVHRPSPTPQPASSIPVPQPASPARPIALATAGVLGAVALGFWLNRDAPEPADPLPAGLTLTSQATASPPTPPTNPEPAAEVHLPEPAPKAPTQITPKPVIKTAKPVPAKPIKPAVDKPVVAAIQPAQTETKPAVPKPAKDEPVVSKPATSRRIILVAWADTTGKSFWSGLSDQAYSGRMAELAVMTLRGELPNGFAVRPDIDKKAAVDMAIKKSDAAFQRVCEAENAAWVFAAHVQESFAVSSAQSAYWPELKLAAWRCDQGGAMTAQYSLSPGNGDDFPFSNELRVALRGFVAARRPGSD